MASNKTSFASKEEYHIHTTIRSHTCFSVGSRLHCISQPLWLSAVSKIHRLKQSRDLTFQICANPSFAWWNQHNRCAPRPPVTKTQKLGPQQKPHASPLTINNYRTSSRAAKISRPRLDHGHTRHLVGLIARRSAKPKKSNCLSHLHMPTHAASVSRSSPRVTWVFGFSSTRLPCIEICDAVIHDVIGWHQQMPRQP